MPSNIDIVNSVQVPQLIKDPVISRGVLVRDKNNRPIHYAGGFAVVFPFEVNGEKWAFRCWSADLGDVEHRLKTISNELFSLNLPYFCQFYYEPEGLVVDGKTYPTTRMKWIDGKDIKEYICSNKDNPERLRSLADSFLSMCQTLHANKIAHGDLQHGNILVDNHNQIFLIDYDSVYLPKLQGEQDIIAGLADYQHPCRRKNTLASEKLDYFSELIIYFSILLITENPSLVEKYRVADAERLLFSREDFDNLVASEIYKDIVSLGNEHQLLLQILQEYLAADDINELEPFDVLLDRYTKEPVIKKFEVEEGSAVYKGSKAQLVWEVENASKILIDGKSVDVNERQMTFSIDKEHQFEIEVINGLKSIKGHCSVELLSEPNISFKISKTKVRKNKGDSVTLKWNVSQAMSAKLISGKQELSNSLCGEYLAFPSATTTYVLEAIGLDGKKIFSKECKVFAFEESDVRFDASKDYSYPGLPIQLQWNIKHAKSVELVGYGEQKKQGTMVVEPKQDTTYELRVCDSFGRKSYYKSIKMLPLPIIETLKIPMPDIQSALKINLVQHPISFNISLPHLPEIKVEGPRHLPKVGLMNPTLISPPIELKYNRQSPIVSFKNIVNSALIKISIWKIKIFQSLIK